MTAGVRIKGSAGNVQIDDQNPVYVVGQSGVFNSANYTEYGDSAHMHRVYFSPAITTQEPPLVFIRFTSPECVMSMFSIVGSPGSWTGFIMRLGYISPQLANFVIDDPRAGQWFTAGVNPGPSSATKGVRIRSRTTGKVIFDTGHRLVRFVEQHYDFVTEGRVTHYTLQYSVGYPTVAGRDVYFLANTFTGMMNFYGKSDADLLWVGYYQGIPNKLWLYTYNGGGDIPYQQYMWSVLFATIN